MGHFATRLSVVEGRLSPVSSKPCIYGLPGYGGIPQAPFTTSTLVHTSAASRPLPITCIPFPHSSSPIPGLASSSQLLQEPHDEDADAVAGPRYFKLAFPTFDGKEDPIGWLNRCKHFFRAQRTRDADKVWLASFHMTSVAQHWYFMLERDMGTLAWPEFARLCQ